jgi:hypothetical protein
VGVERSEGVPTGGFAAERSCAAACGGGMPCGKLDVGGARAPAEDGARARAPVGKDDVGVRWSGEEGD